MKKKHFQFTIVILILVNLNSCGLKEKIALGDLDSRITKTNQIGKLTIHFLDTTHFQDSLLNYLISSYQETDNFFGGEMDQLSVYVDLNSICNGITYVDYNKILLNISDKCTGAFVHELIHAHLGLYKEFWFQEGFATYLSRKIKRDSEDKMIMDANDLWFNNEEKNDSLVCSVNSIFQNHSVDKIRWFFDIKNNNPSLKNSTQQMNYYKLCGSFCEFLTREIGLKKIISISQEGYYNNQSIRTSMSKNNIDIDALYEKWIDKYQGM